MLSVVLLLLHPDSGIVETNCEDTAWKGRTRKNVLVA